MFARRVFELIACNTIVISNSSKGMEKMLGEVILVSDDGNVIREKIDFLLKNEQAYRILRLKALRSVMSEHTYHDRIRQVLKKVYGIEAPRKTKRITVIFIVQEPPLDMPECFKRQTYPDKNIVYLPLSDSAAWMGILQPLISQGDLLTLMDMGDYYGPHYLEDMGLAFFYSDANVINKIIPLRSSVNLVNDGHQYRYVNTIFHNAAMIDPSRVAMETILDYLKYNEFQVGKILCLDEFNYVHKYQHGANINHIDV